MFGASFDTKIAEARKRLAKVEAQIAPIDALHNERDQAAQQLAQLEARKAEAETQLAQLQDARADTTRDLARLEVLMNDHAPAMRFLSGLVDICESGLVGSALPVATARATATRAAEHLDTLRARLADIDARLEGLK